MLLFFYSILLVLGSTNDAFSHCIREGDPLPCQGAKGECSINKDGSLGGFIAAGARVVKDRGIFIGRNLRFNRPYIARYAQVCARAEIADDARIEEDAKIEGWVSVGSKVVVGPKSVIGTIGGDQITIIWDQVSIGQNVKILDGGRIGRSSQIDEGSRLGQNVILGAATHLKAGSEIGNRSKVGQRNVFIQAAKVGSEVRIGDHNFFETGMEIAEKTQIGNFNQFRKGITPLHSWVNGNQTSILHYGVKIGDHNLFQNQIEFGNETEIGSKNRLSHSGIIGAPIRIGAHVTMGDQNQVRGSDKNSIHIGAFSEIGSANEIVETGLKDYVHIGDENLLIRSTLGVGEPSDGLTWVSDQCVLENHKMDAGEIFSDQTFIGAKSLLRRFKGNQDGKYKKPTWFESFKRTGDHQILLPGKGEKALGHSSEGYPTGMSVPESCHQSLPFGKSVQVMFRNIEKVYWADRKQIGKECVEKVKALQAQQRQHSKEEEMLLRGLNQIEHLIQHSDRYGGPGLQDLMAARTSILEKQQRLQNEKDSCRLCNDSHQIESPIVALPACQHLFCKGCFDNFVTSENAGDGCPLCSEGKCSGSRYEVQLLNR